MGGYGRYALTMRIAQGLRRRPMALPVSPAPTLSGPGAAPTAIAPPALAQPAVPSENAEISAAIRRIAWPVIGEQLLQTLVGVVDMAVVGRLGAAEVAGIGTATQLVMIVISAIGAVSVGTTVVVARTTGAGDRAAAGKTTQQSLLVGAVLGFILAIIGGFFADPLIRMLGPEEEVIREGASYLRVSAFAWLPLVAMLVAGGALRGAGDAKTPLRASFWMNVVNACLSMPLAFGLFGLPALGVAGVALASVIARLCGAALVLRLLSKNPLMTFKRSFWRWDGALVMRVLRIGVPTGVEQTMLSGGFLLYGAMVITLGTTVYAAQRISFQAINLAFMPAMGFSTAATTLTGQYLGAKRPELVERSTRIALRQCMIAMLASGAFCAIFAWPLMRLFSNDPEVIRLGAQALPVLSLAQPFWALSNVYAGSLRGGGDSRFPMLSTNLGMWLLRLPSAYLLGIMMHWGLPGVYLSSTFDSGLRAGMNYRRYRGGAWRTSKV